jgi:hypothetical protein
MQEIFSGVSWAGVISGAVVSLLVAWLWYSPKVFGAKWAEGSGVELGDARDMPVTPLVVQFIGLFLMSWFVGVTAVNGALLTVILATSAFCVMYYANGMFGQRSAYARGVDVGYWVIALVVMIIFQGIF